ncbi:MAG: response regulator [Caldilinea sp.]|nr:response regulator [Caldilinea sp.]
MPFRPVILIVDDDPLNRMNLEALLTPDGYDLHFAATGAEALVLAMEVHPDLVLLDVMMPEMDGYEVCRRLRADPTLSEVPIVLVTVLDDEASLVAGLESGADDFLSKPYSSVELLARVRSILRTNRFRQLRIGRERLAWVLDVARSGFVVLDAETHIVYANTAARRFLYLDDGPLPDDLCFRDAARNGYELRPAEAWGAWPASHLEDRTYLVRHEDETAPAFWLAVRMIALSAGDHAEIIVYLRDVTADVTERRDMRAFHTTVAHKLRTPVNGLQTSLLLMQMEGAGLDLPPAFAQMLDMAVQSAERLNATVEDVVAFLGSSRLVAVETGPLLIDLQRLLNGVVKGCGGDVEVATEIAPALRHARIGMKEAALRTIFQELLENSCKFHPDHTPVVVVTAAQATAGRVTLRVVDDGTTMTAQQVEWALQPYIQGEKYFTGEAPGTGLGLPTVAMIVWQLGGDIHIKSRRDAPGVVVELTLPLVESGDDGDAG